MRAPFLSACILLLLAAAPAGAGVKAWLDSSQISQGESVKLTMEHDGQVGTQPDLAPLSKDFDILQQASSSNLRIINGRISSGVEISLTLSPRHTGALVIPALTWGADRTEPLTVNVSGGGGSQPGAASAQSGKVFIETEIAPKKPFVLSAVHLTVRVYTALTLYRASLELPTSDAVLVRQEGEDQSGTSDRNGTTYHVVTRHYLLFPQHSGALSLPGATLNAQVESSSPRSNPYDPFSAFSGMVSNTRPIRLHGDPIALDVQPRPAAVASPYWLPAQEVSLEARWQPETLQAHVGDPITVDLELKALGLTAAQLPDLAALLSIPASLKVYPEQPKLKDVDQSDSVLGTRQQSIAVIADQPGRYAIPALQLSWWDTKANQQREVSAPARTLEVLPAAGGAPAAGAAASAAAPVAMTPAAPAAPAAGPAARPAPAGGLPWQSISIALLGVWLATLDAWFWRTRRRAGPGPKAGPPLPDLRGGASRERAAFQQACRQHDALAARRHLLAWAQEALGADAPAGLGALARHLDDPALTPLLQGLDRACFAQGRPGWDGEPLGRALTTLAAPGGRSGRKADGLAPLYPS